MALIYNGSQVNSLIYNGNETTGMWNGEVVWSPIPPSPPIIDEVTIGTQTWKTKNLAIDDGGTGIKVVNDVTVNGVNLGTQYYYTAEAAKRVANTISGWHLPSKSEYITLYRYLSNSGLTEAEICTKLRSNYAWSNNGTDDYGFCALPLGMYNDSDVELFIGLSYSCWTSTDYLGSYYYYCDITEKKYEIADYYKKAFKLGVRLIKDT